MLCARISSHNYVCFIRNISHYVSTLLKVLVFNLEELNKLLIWEKWSFCPFFGARSFMYSVEIWSRSLPISQQFFLYLFRQFIENFRINVRRKSNFLIGRLLLSIFLKSFMIETVATGCLWLSVMRFWRKVAHSANLEMNGKQMLVGLYFEK